MLFGAVDIVDTGAGEAVDFLAPGILALAVMSTAFTGQAIATGFERRYGVLKRLGRLAAAPLGADDREDPLRAGHRGPPGRAADRDRLRAGLVAARQPASPSLLLLVLGTAAFSGLGLLMAGTLKAEATLAAANLVFLLLLVGGGVDRAAGQVPGRGQAVLGLLPISALSDGLRDVLQHGAGMPWGDLGILAVWAVVGLARGRPVLPLGVGDPGHARWATAGQAPRESVHKRPPTMVRVPNADPRRRRRRPCATRSPSSPHAGPRRPGRSSGRPSPRS